MQHYQQPLDITIQGNEECYFRVLGCHTVHLTGNYVLDDLPDSDDEEEEDSEEEEEYDTLDNMLLNANTDSEEDESEEDELDGLANPRITELDEEKEEEEAPQLVKSGKQKSKKRPADDEEVEAITGPSAKAEDSGKANRNSKKLKTNAGDAVATGKSQPQKTEASKKTETENKPKSKKEQAKLDKELAKKNEQSQTNGKKVQFAEKLEQGPTPPKAAAEAKGPRNVNGVMVDDKRTGTGPAAKKGDKVGMRYIGKLKDGKVFDGMQTARSIR